MTALNYIMIGILYFWCSSTALSFGIGYYTLYRPIISGMLTGLILGDVQSGMMAGSIVNIIYIDFVSTGGSLKGDQCLTAIIAAISSIVLKLTPVEAAAIAYPFGYAGILIWKYRLNINCIFVKKYNERYKSGLKPNISIYDGFLPQAVLFVMSVAVIIVSSGALMMLKNFVASNYAIVGEILFFTGIFLINISIIKVLLNLKNNKAIILFFVTVILIFILNINSILIMFMLFALIFVFTYRDLVDLKDKNETTESENKSLSIVLKKKDLFYSWFIWMNFSHSCYNFERLQGMAFAHSMKNIVKKLYKEDDIVKSIIYQYTEFFNTEPNIGTPIHGYIISLEEQKSLGNETVNISYVKKGMMGLAAGLGDSFTQVVLTPIFISAALMLCMDGKFAASMVPILLLVFIILYFSYSGWINGYYKGREVLLKRISLVKKSRIKKYFHLIFSFILACTVGKLLVYFSSAINMEIPAFSIIAIISIAYSVVVILKREVKA